MKPLNFLLLLVLLPVFNSMAAVSEELEVGIFTAEEMFLTRKEGSAMRAIGMSRTEWQDSVVSPIVGGVRWISGTLKTIGVPRKAVLYEFLGEFGQTKSVVDLTGSYVVLLHHGKNNRLWIEEAAVIVQQNETEVIVEEGQWLTDRLDIPVTSSACPVLSAASEGAPKSCLRLKKSNLLVRL